LPQVNSPLHFCSGVHGWGGGFEPPTFGLCDLTHLSMRVGLSLRPRGMLAIQSLRLPPQSRGLASVCLSSRPGSRHPCPLRDSQRSDRQRRHRVLGDSSVPVVNCDQTSVLPASILGCVVRMCDDHKASPAPPISEVTYVDLMSTILVVIVVLLLLDGGGWGYSRRYR
jgi:hypothetical protein